MEVGNNRRRSTSSSRNNNGVVVATGSVWENRMKLDEVKGGFKVFSNNNNDETPNENDGKDCNFISGSNTQVDKKLDMGPKKTNIGVVGVSGKRKTWKTESSPIQIASKRSGLSKKLDEKCDLSKNLDEKCKDLSVSVDGVVGFTMKNGKAENFDGNQIQIASKSKDLSKNLGEKCKNLSVSADGVVGTTRKTWKSESLEGNSIQIASKRSDLSKNLEEKYKDLSKFFDDKCKDLSKNLDEKCKDVSVSGDGVCKKVPNQSKKNSELRKLKSESVNGNVKKSNLDVRILKKSNLEESSENLEGSIGIKKTKSEEFGMCEEKFITSNVVSEAKSANKLEKNLENEDDNEEWDDVLEDEIDEEIEKKSVDVKEIRVQEQNKPKKIVIEEKKFQYNNKRQIPVSSINKKQSPPTLIHAKIHPSPTRTKSVPVSDEFQSRKHSKLQSLVDLVMWRNVSKSALVFGIGTFVIISSSYTQDLNISFISVLSCLGLVYLAAIFLFRSLIHRRAVDIGESSEYVVGEEEAVWILKLILPFINEFLLKIRALFSGDPSTTMKMAVLLFLLAKFGSYITIWKLSKLGFFGVFVIPKVCSSYSTQLTSYGTFLIMYIRDAWESCNHKKAVGFAIFTLVWNFSSIIARIWAVFMLYVGFRYYQQTLMREDTTIKADDFLQGKIREQRQVGRKPNSMDTRKQKKAF
ncbi:reticulon-like protein B21 isoform X6 [Lycium ferocissimum]|uniref:reticulon-like protein B21 isoform X6 n=1 Tax=Lycium ferocissimum TaxID=112874 RepID=UPI0028157D40|nr:reticulon-like protein B21 isoform X6 [Lycium ferocissimum]